jgi:hypothetical protein
VSPGVSLAVRERERERGHEGKLCRVGALAIRDSLPRPVAWRVIGKSLVSALDLTCRRRVICVGRVCVCVCVRAYARPSRAKRTTAAPLPFHRFGADAINVRSIKIVAR